MPTRKNRTVPTALLGRPDWMVAILVVTILLIALIDVQMPLGVVAPIGYVAVILLTIRLSARVVLVVTATTLLNSPP